MAKRAKAARARPQASRAAVPRAPSPIPSIKSTSIPTPAAFSRRPAYTAEFQDEIDMEGDSIACKMANLELRDGSDSGLAPGDDVKVRPKRLKPAKPFRFMDLPSELRLKVYGHHFDAIIRTIDLSPENYALIHKKMKVFRVCRQVYREASHYFYANHDFRLFPTHPGRFFKTKKPLLARLKPSQRASITSLELRVGPGWSKPPRGWVVNSALGLSDCVNVRQVIVFVECDPSDSIFNGFRRSEGFYEGFCQSLLDGVLKGLPSIERVVFDAWSSVKKNGAMMRALLAIARDNHMMIVWGTERGWTNTDDEDHEDSEDLNVPIYPGEEMLPAMLTGLVAA